MAVRELNESPNLKLLYPRALAGATVRPVLQYLPGLSKLWKPDAELPETELQLGGIVPDREQLASYARVCGLSLRDELAATYPHVLCFPLAMQLMTDPSFPFSVLGLVHIRNRISQLRPLRGTEPLNLRVRAEGLRSHSRGRQFDVVCEASADGETVWTEQSTYLRRGASDGSSSSGSGPSERAAHLEPSAVWDVPEDIGRRYAAVSGDTNPIHLHWISARLFGLPKPIAHGMWLKARCLAGLEGVLSDAFDIEVEFKRPVYLPAQVSFASQADGDQRQFALTDKKSGKAHLTGTVALR